MKSFEEIWKNLVSWKDACFSDDPIKKWAARIGVLFIIVGVLYYLTISALSLLEKAQPYIPAAPSKLKEAPPEEPPPAPRDDDPGAVEEEDIVLLKLLDNEEAKPAAPNVLQAAPEYQPGLYEVVSIAALDSTSENFSAHWFSTPRARANGRKDSNSSGVLYGSFTE